MREKKIHLLSSLHFLGIYSLTLILFSRSSQASIEKKEHERQEKLLKGPGTFPLERLLAIFCCISAEFVDDEDEMDASMMTSSEVKHGVEMSSDVLMQISTLVKSNLLYKGTSDPLEGTPRYRCNVNEELVQMVILKSIFLLDQMYQVNHNYCIRIHMIS